LFSADTLLIEKAQIALLAAAGDEPCAVSGPLERPYQSLLLAVFRGDEGKRLAAQARTGRRLAFQDRDYRVIADLSAPLGCEDALIIEAA
jgi:hypothetical protein